MLRVSGLAFGAGAVDPAVELAHDASPGTRAFAHFVAGLVRLCAKAAAISGAPYFSAPPSAPPAEAIQARRTQALAVLGAVADCADDAAPLFRDPLAASESAVRRIAGAASARLARRYLAEGGPFAGLPLHNGLRAIEARTVATVALAGFDRGRLSRAGAYLAGRAALHWRAVLVELLAGLARTQRNGKENERALEQVLRAQRLPVREARLLRRALRAPRSVEALVPALTTEALRRFALEQALLAALVTGDIDAGEMAFVHRLAAALGVDGERLAATEAAVRSFYREYGEAFTAQKLAETPEGLPHALTTRLQEVVLDNLDRLLQEIRETGELAELLAKGASGATLTAAEKAKVREQLLDLAKTIPALAIFAAPGGMLLLPILLKLLPFNLLPSSFSDPPPRMGEGLPSVRPQLPNARKRSDAS